MKALPLENTDYGVTLVDDGAYERLRWYRWNAEKGSGSAWYAAHYENGRGRLQNLIMRPSPGFIVDHVNGNTLDNQRANLRFATQAQNVYNHARRRNSLAPFAGVQARGKRWIAKIQHARRGIYLGMFNTDEDAARAYDAAALRLFGEFARLNFPDAHRIARGQPSQAQRPPTAEDEARRSANFLLLTRGAILFRDLACNIDASKPSVSAHETGTSDKLHDQYAYCVDNTDWKR